MVISVEAKFTKLKEQLRGLGFIVYDINERIPSDAYIYSEGETGFKNISNIAVPDGEGAILINGDNKELSEIIYTLKHKLYSPLFNITYHGKDFV